MENCNHEKMLESVRELGKLLQALGPHIEGVRSIAETIKAEAEPPKPEVMSLEEVAEQMAEWGRCTMIPGDRVQMWHRAITAHLEGEPKGLTAKEIGWIKVAAQQLEGVGYEQIPLRLREIAARHTKGGKA